MAKDVEIERPEMLHEYFRRKGFFEAEEVAGEKKLDPIDPKTVGRLHLEIWAARALFPWMAEARAMLREGRHEQKTASAATPEPHVRVSPDVEKLAPGLCRLGLLRRRRRGEKIRARCGIFMVPKKNDLWRLVFDARPANRITEKLSNLRMFGLDELLDAFSFLRKGRTPVYLWTADFKHFFYQLPLAAALQSLFGAGAFIPLVFPMGFHSSPEVGQVVSWSTVLAKEAGESSLGAGDVSAAMPTVLALKDIRGETIGFVFVLLDNICVMTVDRQLTVDWSARIRRNANLFNLEFKESEVGFTRIADESLRAPGTPPCDAVDWKESCTFAGLEFSRVGWRSGSADRSLPLPDTRRRTLAVCGSLLWEVRVRRLPLRQFPKLREIYHLVGQAAGGWDSPFAFPADCEKEIEDLKSLRSARSWTGTTPPRSPPRATVTAATDATRETIAWVLLSPAEDVYAAMISDHDVAWAELHAIVELAKEVTRAVGPDVELRILSDSQVAVAVVEKGYSSSPQLDALAQELGDLVDRFGLRIRCGWLPSGSNVADTPSRRVANKRCGKCEGWRKADYPKDAVCRCERPNWEVSLGALCPHRKELSKASVEAFFPSN